MTEIEAAKQRIVAARASRDGLGLRNAHMDAFNEYGALATALLSARDYAGADKLLLDWGEALESAKKELKENQLLYGHSRRQAALGNLAEIKGLEAYFVYGDFVDAPRLLENSEVHHERAGELTAKVAFPQDAPPEARAMQDKIAAMQRAEIKRVRGMRLLVQGEFESEAGGLDRAVNLLAESVQTLQAGEAEFSASAPDEDAVALVLEKGKRELNFIDFAQALLHKTRSDEALFAGDLATAAQEQLGRAEALRRCQSMHARVGQALNESFARRLARDVHVANQRHDRLAAEALKKPKWEWLKAVVFFLMAVGSTVLFMCLAARFEVVQNKAIFTLLLFFVMAIAGIGARLVQWKEAANWLRGSAAGKS